MSEPLVVAVAQPACRSYDVPANVATHAATIRAAAARVVVFPELSITGYELDAPTIARVGLAICRDTGIPRHTAGTVALGSDVYVASLLASEADADGAAERARRVAVEHAVWVAIASFAGTTGGGYDRAAGRSGIWAPGGLPVVQAGPEPNEIVRATLE